MMNQSLTLAEMLASLRPLFERAMTATDDGTRRLYLRVATRSGDHQLNDESALSPRP